MISDFQIGKASICPELFNVTEYVLGPADKIKNKVALSMIEKSERVHWTYEQLQSAVISIALGLISHGLRPQNKVLLQLGNTIEFPISFLATIAVGIVPVPISTDLTEREIKDIMAILNPVATLVESNSVRKKINGERFISLDELTKTNVCRSEFKYFKSKKNDLAYIVFTSGSSGTPIGVKHAHRAIWARKNIMDSWSGLNRYDRTLHFGALNWTFTLGTGLLDPWSRGATAIIPGSSILIDNLLDILKEEKVTIFSAVPNVFRKCLKRKIVPRLNFLRHGLTAGEKLSPEIYFSWKTKTGKELYEAFGMTECSTFISNSCSVKPDPEKIGKAQFGRRISILPIRSGEDPVPIGDCGLISIHRSDPGLMLGYLNIAKKRDECFRGNWFVSSDLGIMDKDGFVSYCGRVDDVITAGGFRVSPIEIEAFFMKLPEIENMVVTEIEIKKKVKIIVAFYIAKNKLRKSFLNKYAMSGLAKFKRPKFYIQCDSFPTNRNGKISRRKMVLAKDCFDEKP